MVNLSSAAGNIAIGSNVMYCASKAALDKYLQEHPGAGTGANTVDPTLNDLQQQYNNDRTRYSDLQAKIDQITTQAQSGSVIDTSFFREVETRYKLPLR